MKYEKPVVIAQNGNNGSFAAGCPANRNFDSTNCKSCERTR